MTTRHAVRPTPDSHVFETRPYDLVKEFAIALAAVAVVTVLLAAAFSSPDEPALTARTWAQAAPADVVATAAGELAGTTTSSTYGPPYNSASTGQQLGPLRLQQWAGVRQPVSSADDLVVRPLTASALAGDRVLGQALRTWQAAPAARRTTWATEYTDALAKAPAGDPARVRAGSYGPVPVMTSHFLTLARTGGLDQAISENFYTGDQTRPLLLLTDGTYLEAQARARGLGGDQWGMMNEAGNYPGQPWMWLYTFWYQVEPFKSSPNADALVWGLMMLLTLVLALVPFVPGLRRLPERVPVHRLVWRRYYQRHGL